MRTELLAAERADTIRAGVPDRLQVRSEFLTLLPVPFLLCRKVPDHPEDLAEPETD